MPNYKKGKIYSIRSYQTDDIYIGSTTRPLSERMADHRRKYKYFLQGKTKSSYYTSFEIIKRGDAYIELIEEIPCNNVNELTKFEGNYIRNMDCINKRNEARTKKEKQEYNKKYFEKYDKTEKRIKYKKQRQQKRKHIKYNCCCGSITLLKNKQSHFRSIKHRQYIFNLHNELNHL